MARRFRWPGPILAVPALVVALAVAALAADALVARLRGGDDVTAVDSDLVALVDGRLVRHAIADSSAPTRPLTLPPTVAGIDHRTLALSPEGDRIAYACDPATAAPAADGRGLCGVDLDPAATPALLATGFAPVRFPSWSLDGRLAYAALDGGGRGSIWVVDPGRPVSAPETLCEDWCPLFRYYSLAWSPDGSKIAVAAETPGSGGHPARIVLFDVASHEFDFLTEPTAGIQHAPTWSPDGRHIAYASTAGGGFDLWVADVASGASRRLTTTPDQEVTPAWSPTGDTIVYVADDDDGWHLRRIDPEGGPSSVVTRVGAPLAPRFVAAEPALERPPPGSATPSR